MPARASAEDAVPPPLQEVLDGVVLTRDFSSRLPKLRHVKAWRIEDMSRFWEVCVPLLFNPAVTGASLASDELTKLVSLIYRFFVYHERRVPVGDGPWGCEAETAAAFDLLRQAGVICEEARGRTGGRRRAMQRAAWAAL